MADLDVAVRLRFLTTGDDKLKAAARDLAAFGKATGKLSTAATGRLGGDLNKAWSASVKLGGALDKSAGAATRTATALGRIGGEARDIDRTRVAVERLSKANKALGGAHGKIGRDALGRFAGAGAGAVGPEGLVAAGAIGGAMSAKRRAALKEGLAEAASRVTPNGYLLGAGGAVALGATVGGTAAAGIGAAALATKEAISREKAFADIQKKVNLDAGESFDTLDRKVRKVSTTLGMAYQDAAGIFAQGAQGGIASRDLEDFAMLGAKVSTAWDIGAKEAATTLTEVHGQTGWTNKQMEVFADKVNFLGDNSAAAEKDIARMWQIASAGAKAAGVSYDDSMVAMTALRGVGMQDDVASRFFGALSSKLRTASSLSKDAQGAFKELGLSAKGVEKDMQTDAMGAMLNFFDRLGKSTNSVKLARDILGGEWFDEGLRMQQALPELIRLRDALAKGGYAGSLDNALKIDMSTTEAQLGRVKQAFLDIIATAAKPVALPAIKGAADWLTGKAQEMREAQQRSEDSRAQVKPKGLSVTEFERVHRLDRTYQPPPMTQKVPMIAGIEGVTPHVDVKQANIDMANATAKANDLYGALQLLNAGVTVSVNVGAAIESLGTLEKKAAAVMTTLRGLSNFGPPAIGGTRVNPTLTGAPSGGGGTPAAAPAAATPGKQARLNRGGGVQIAQAHFHGVKDVAALHRQLAGLQSRAIRSSRDGALHDLA